MEKEEIKGKILWKLVRRHKTSQKAYTEKMGFLRGAFPPHLIGKVLKCVDEMAADGLICYYKGKDCIWANTENRQEVFRLIKTFFEKRYAKKGTIGKPLYLTLLYLTCAFTYLYLFL